MNNNRRRKGKKKQIMENSEVTEEKKSFVLLSVKSDDMPDNRNGRATNRSWRHPDIIRPHFISPSSSEHCSGRFFLFTVEIFYGFNRFTAVLMKWLWKASVMLKQEKPCLCCVLYLIFKASSVFLTKPLNWFNVSGLYHKEN